jgi:diguanylate cyclase (GGDEF)-like protein
MSNIAEILIREPVTISPDNCVRRAAVLMERFRVGGLPVLKGRRLVGIITSRDIRCTHPNRLVVDAMSVKAVTVGSDCSLWEAKEVLERHGIERLMVVKGEELVGIVTKSRLYAELGKHVDALTGLEQAGFLQRVAAELLHQGREIAVIFLDLDNFGVIDKEQGHVVGDRILQQVARVLCGLVEEGVDYLCRYAGDEFAVVTVRPLEDVRKLAHRMVVALANENWPHGVKVTGSVGVAGGRRYSRRAEGNRAPYTVADLINMASLASTKAKREGKPVEVVERVVVWG